MKESWIYQQGLVNIEDDDRMQHFLGHLGPSDRKASAAYMLSAFFVSLIEAFSCTLYSQKQFSVSLLSLTNRKTQEINFKKEKYSN
eukprot:c29344_g3_i1 orf=34-291(-)